MKAVSASQWLRPAVGAAVDVLFPPRCAACGEPCEPRLDGPLFCVACDEALAINERPTCMRCAMTCSVADVAAGNCSNCRGSKLLFSAARSIGPYETALRQAVLKGKHASFEPLAIALGHRLAEVLERSPFDERPDVVVPVPMHWLKRLWRGTNPAATIGRSVAGALGLPLAESALVCTRLLRRQATLTPPERRRNVRRAFRASRWAAVARKRILLVDDVMTTGATAHEGARALLDAGATAVYVATVARSSPQF